MEDFIKNNGKMNLVTSIILSDEDYNKIKETEENPEKIIEKQFIKDLNNIKESFIKDHLSALAWMLVQGNLEIKVAYPTTFNGLFHPKVGILKDSENNIITFSGSDNETEKGWTENIEEFKVFQSWKNGHEQFIIEDITSFEKYWKDWATKTKVIDMPKAIKEELIQLAPDDIEDLNLKDKYSINTYSKNLKTKKDKSKNHFDFRDYQYEAMNAWFDNNKKGILEMATGTGKTCTAIGCLERLKKEHIHNNKPLLTIIACPTSVLVEQWEKDIIQRKFDTVIKVYHETNWKKELSDKITDLNIGISSNMVILTTHKTFCSYEFIQYINRFKYDTLLIVDEVHAVGARTFRYGLNPDYKYRLGLSATPDRWYDEEGNDIIENYFEKIVFSFDLHKALTEINPNTELSYLTPYEYKPCFCKLNKYELQQYSLKTLSIIYAYNSKGKDRDIKLAAALAERQKIINKADDKFDKLKKVLDDIKNTNDGKINNLIIYCADTEQLKQVLKILEEKNITKHKFTGQENSKKRDKLLNSFSIGSLDCLVAMKCLDEGVDIPSAKTAIIMASTSNPREYIQRRGRILRRSKNKNLAIIYDMIIFPHSNELNLTEEQIKIEKIIMKKEKRRFRDFAEDANNGFNCINLLENY